MSLRPSTRSLLALAVLLATGGAGCSRATHTPGANRPLLHVESDGLTLDVVARQELVSWSSGLAPAGRWFGWEDCSVECVFDADVRVSHAGQPDYVRRVHLASPLPRSVVQDEASCRQGLQEVVSAACSAQGRIAFELDGVWRVVEAFGGQAWVVEAGRREWPDCAALLASMGTTLELVARSHVPGACDALITHGAADLATRCVLDYDSMGVADSFSRDGELAAIEASRAGAPPPSTVVRWAALVAAGAGAGDALDMEAAFYRVLLDGEEDFRAYGKHMALGLAFTPSRARRRAFIQAGVARCEADRIAEWQRDALALAAAGLGDAALSAEVKRACGVDPDGADRFYFPHRLEP